MAEKVTELRSYDATWDKPMKSYWAIDPQGKKVKINTKNTAKHQSNNPIEQRPTYFHNLGYVLSNPDHIEASTSNHPMAIASRLEGEILIYTKEDYINSLKMPGHPEIHNEQTKVVVFYGNDGKNFTKTYRTDIK